MPYVTLQQLTERYGARTLVSLTDRGAVATEVVDDDVIDRAIADADALIDSYLAGRYALPLTSAQPVLTQIAGALVFAALHVFDRPESVREDQKEALRQLQAIAMGTMRLNAEGIAPAGTGGTGARLTDRERPMDEKTMKGFI